MTQIHSNDIPDAEIAAYILRIFSDPENGISVPTSGAEMMVIAKQWLVKQIKPVPDKDIDDK